MGRAGQVDSERGNKAKALNRRHGATYASYGGGGGLGHGERRTLSN